MTALALIPPRAFQGVSPSAPPATSYRYLWSPATERGEAFHGLLLEAWLPFGMGFSREAHSTNSGHFRTWWNFRNEQGHVHTQEAFPRVQVAGTLAYVGACWGVDARAARELTEVLQQALEAIARPVERRLAEWLSPTPCSLEGLPVGPWRPLSL